MSAVAEHLGRHPRHVVLTAYVLGLLLVWTPAPAAGAAGLVALVLAGRRLLIGLTLVALLAGLGVAQHRLGQLSSSSLAPLMTAAAPGALDVTVTAPVRSTARGGRTALVELRGEPVLLRLPRADPPGAQGSGGPRPGHVVRVTGRLTPPDRHARLVRAHAVLRARTVAATGDRRAGLAGALDRVRERSQRAFASALRPDTAGLLQGMVLGDDSAMPLDLREAMRTSGLAHLVAASGQNVMLLATLVFLIGGALGTSWRSRILGALALTALYVPLAGGGPSIQRAGVMGAAGLLAALAGRPSSRWYAVLLAAAVTLTLDPRACGDAGWRLSFAAVLGLLALGPPLHAGLTDRGVPRPLADAVATTLAATVATAPVIAATFGQTSLVALPANVLAAPLVLPVMWVGFVAAAIAQVSAAAAAWLAGLAALPLHGLVLVGRHGAEVPGATAAAPVWAVAAVCAVVAAAIRWPRARAPAPAALAGLVALALALAPRPAPVLGPPAGLRISFLDVGQGDATLLQHESHAVLVDTGPPSGPVLDRLRRFGVRHLDALVLTHAQSDHAGAAVDVLEAIPTDIVLDGRDGAPFPEGAGITTAARRAGARSVVPDRGQVLRVGPIALHVLSPRREPAAWHAGADPNERAIVLEVRCGDTRALLPADAESDVLRGLDLAGIDVLKVAHHGSADPGLADLLERLRPRIAVVSAGAGNPFGHPRPETVRTLRAGVAVVRRTDRDGTVVLDDAPGGTTVRSLR